MDISRFKVRFSKEFYDYIGHGEEGCVCLNCGRCVMAGPKCCNNPRLKSETEEWKAEDARLKAIYEASEANKSSN